ncbi:hypothetical protein CAL29_14740 [Bordetella genomosp. 10]|uniref:Uncharacterized protein n=1 Tax=Bordetella genomosp. 10 TaxID=1416804 RepID=A0A261SBE4_9BORD|nr:4'-phosphopantetheinyl transferase superfamily protein [Bordetella genomosp. 10]OZI34728.1 hypothetical protein CAL29_14740 [Bordetella genomosp. 10]
MPALDDLRMLSSLGRWPADVEVWLADLSAYVFSTRYLNDDECARAQRYRNARDAQRFAVTRSLLRQLLGKYAGQPAAALRFVYTDRGRPELPSAYELSFNVSHSGDYALIVVSRCRAVGIDIERVNPSIDWQGMLPLVCTDSESVLLSAAAPEDRTRLFFDIWTGKEALLKTLGHGITEALQKVTLDFCDPARPLIVVEDPSYDELRGLRLGWLREIPFHSACVAWAQHAGGAAHMFA